MTASSSPPVAIRYGRRFCRSGSVLLLVLIVIVLMIGVGALGWYYLQQQMVRPSDSVMLTTAVRGPFEHIVLEQGTVESSSNVEIRCEVKSRSAGGTELLWVVDEGTHVKQGEKLVTLDSSALEQELVQQQIVCNTCQAAVIQAENTLRAAEISRTEFLEGTFRQQEQEILSAIFVAEENLRRAQLAFQSTERLAARGIVTALQLEGDQFAVDKARNELESAQTKLEVLRKYTKAKTLKQFDSDIATAQAKWESEKESFGLEQKKLQDIKDQIARCTLLAPEDGQVVYANSFDHGGGAEFVVEPGASVREGQSLIRLPDPTKMQVKATINESRISLIKAGMPVAIEFDALRDKTLKGIVTKVNQYAEPSSWRSGNIKEYAAFIAIFDPPADVRTGMNAEVRIFVEQREAVLQVPVQTLLEVKGHYFCLVQRGENWETREVQVGSSNDSFMTIKEGLQDNDVVIMNPRAHPDKLQLPDLPDPSPDANQADQPAVADLAVDQNGDRDPGRKRPPPEGGTPRDASRQGGAGS